jgi:hypothetical protein
MADIINLAHYADALRNTGYKNVDSAIAEIIDNSLEADAKDVLVICDIDSTSKEINDIAILDNGTGMDLATLNISLSLGDSTRRDRKGIGRFGVGLPQASLFIAPKVEVYSWQNGIDNSYYVYLDINEIKEGKQKTIQDAIKKSIPSEYLNVIKSMSSTGSSVLGKMQFKEHGTLVLWRDCDKLYPKSPNSLFSRFEFYLGRKFRYFLQEGRKIGLTIRNSNAKDTIIKPNDPLYLMEENQIKGDLTTRQPSNSGESIFEPWENEGILGETTISIPYIKNKKRLEADVRIKFSIAKEEFQKEGGDSDIGKHAKRNVGISIIRSNREIDFGKFDFFSDVNEPQHRWWGCEVSFPTELDEVFKVANNKQQIQLFEPDSAGEDSEVGVWTLLNKVIGPEIRAIYKKLKSRTAGSRSKKKEHSVTIEEVVINRVEQNNVLPTESQINRKKLGEEQVDQLIKERLIEAGNPEPSKEIIESIKKNRVNLEQRDLGDGSNFIDISTRMGTCILTINTSSIFFLDLYHAIQENPDKSILRAFNLMLSAFASAEDEASVDPKKKESYLEVREAWGKKIRQYLKTDYKA